MCAVPHAVFAENRQNRSCSRLAEIAVDVEAFHACPAIFSFFFRTGWP
jgi:hypothetical protein